ncbi:MAG: efflux RND transporter permease subunit, partial [Burkholderiaceae bacterium]|nr:efflux RND transporter permease subunit [Burkholderiaceae bacterium]
MARFFIDRPVFAWVIAIFILLGGILSITVLPISQYPTIAPPQVTITAIYPGASAKTLEDSVTSIIEQEMNGAEGLQYMESVSQSNGQAQITVTFKAGMNVELAAVDVQNRIKRVEARLPDSVKQQGVQVNKANSSILMFVNMYSEDGKLDPVGLGDYLARNVVNEIKRVPGVGDVNLFGSEKAMRIWIDPVKLSGLKLSSADVATAIKGQNAQVSAGSLAALPNTGKEPITATVVVSGQLQTAEQFGNVVLRANADGSVVRLRDVARIELGGQTYETTARLNGKTVSGFAVMPTATANALAVATAVRAKMDELSKYFPPGVKHVVPYDTTKFVQVSIHEVAKTLLEAVVLVFLVMFLFLQNIRYTIIPTIVVPVALMGTFAVMNALGYSINVLTMFGMVLAIGILVDDAIVVVENVERIMATEGLAPREATAKAMGQITGAIIGITVVLIAVFVPMAFFGGAVGAIYRQFSVAMIASMVFSAIMALSLTPALCATILKPIPQGEHYEAKGIFGWFNRKFSATTAGYERVVTGMLGKLLRWMVVY